jgi:hypothetical protein
MEKQLQQKNTGVVVADRDYPNQNDDNDDEDMPVLVDPMA